MTPGIYELRALVCEEDAQKRLQALLDWERRWVRELYVTGTLARELESYPARAQQEATAALRRSMAIQLGGEVVREATEKITEGWPGKSIHMRVQVIATEGKRWLGK